LALKGAPADAPKVLVRGTGSTATKLPVNPVKGQPPSEKGGDTNDIESPIRDMLSFPNAHTGSFSGIHQEVMSAVPDDVTSPANVTAQFRNSTTTVSPSVRT
jgi:hypothetical protein